jgi:hypothetical protein
MTSPVSKMDPGAEDAFFSGNSKYFEQVRNNSKQAFSIMFCWSTAWTMLPPMVVYQSGSGALFKDWCVGRPEGTLYASSKNGWFDMNKFNQWFRDVRSF